MTKEGFRDKNPFYNVKHYKISATQSHTHTQKGGWGGEMQNNKHYHSYE